MLATRKRALSLLLAMLLLSLSMLTGCGANKAEEKTIQDVLAATYTGPDPAYAEAFAKQEAELAAAQQAAGSTEIELTEENSSLLKYTKQRFGPMLTDKAYAFLIANKTADTFPQRCLEKGWTTELKNVKLLVREKHCYTYTATVRFHLDAAKTETKDITVTGSIDFDETGKIRWFKPSKNHAGNEMMRDE